MYGKKAINAGAFVILAVLSSCQLQNLFRNAGNVDLFIENSNPSWEEYDVQLSGYGPSGEVLSQSASWGTTELRDLSIGAWQFEVAVSDGETGVVAGGMKIVTVEAGQTATVDIPISEVDEDELQVEILDPPESYESGTEYTVSTSYSGSPVSYEYRWYLDGVEVSSDSDWVIPGSLGIGSYSLTVSISDLSTGASGTAVASFEITSPYEEIRMVDDQFTLYWEAPSDDSIVSAYNIYASPHNRENWTRVGSVEADAALEFIVGESLIEPGLWDFATASVSSDGRESERHTSLDENTDPSGGWYVNWQPE